MKKTNKRNWQIYNGALKRMKKTRPRQMIDLIILSVMLIVLVFMSSFIFLFFTTTNEKLQNKGVAGSYCSNFERSNGQNGIYNDKEYGFTIKYPNYFNDPIIKIIEAAKEEVQKSIELKIDGESSVWIYVWNNEAIMKGESPDGKYNILEINSRQALQSKDIKELPHNSSDTKKYLLNTYIYSKSQVYQINYIGSSDRDNIQLYKDMVTSFIVDQ